MSLGKFKKAGTAVLLSSMLLVACGGGENRQAEYLNKAQEYFDQENFDKAKIEVKNVLQINPNNADARYLSGMIAESNKNFRGAFKNFNAAVEIDDSHIKSLNKLASYFYMSKDLDGAQEKVDAVLAVDANNADALGTQSAIFASQEKKDQAIEKAQLALSIEPGHVQATTVLAALYAEENPELALETITKGIASQSKSESLKLLKIRLMANQKNRDGAIQLFRELIAEYPENIIYVGQLANYQLQSGATEENIEQRKADAEKTLREAVATNSEEDQFKLWLVEFLLKNRGVESGREQLEEYISALPDNFAMRDKLARVYTDNKEIDKAIALYQYVIDTTPKDTIALDARNRLAVIAILQEDREKADLLLAEIFELEPENTDALLVRAKLKLQENDIDGAIPDLRVVLKNDPESVEALTLLAVAHQNNNSADLALDNYQRLLIIEPKNLPALVGSARLLIAKGQLEDALSQLEVAKGVNDSNPEVVQLLTNLYTREQRWDDALSTAAKLTENSQTMAIGYYLQGRVYLRQKEYATAVGVLEKSIELQPAGVETLSSLAAAYVALEKTEKAIGFVKAHAENYPDQIHAKELLANLYLRSGDQVSALSELQAAIAQDPDRNSAYLSIARIYFVQGKPEKIESLYLDGLKQNPKNNGLRLALAEYYQSTKQHQQAVDSYETLLADNPDALVVKNNLAVLLMDHFNSAETVTRAAELAADLAATENPAFLDTAGWVQYQQGNYPQAVSLLSAAIEFGGKGADYHYHLGMAYYKSDMKQQAKEQLELALADKKADFAGKEEAESTLQQLQP
ncbi:MAG: tetratricopeptide repeat protein [Oceanicoccus sp.]|uniref:tetratricopeptide repeat protein n=1 Tax=Oceanicoccus sp. TaxID=2691044 RepID=UPI002639B220|nr:tetratricopeptide repeat protein [Oceanicoccus sp.]MCP3908873.1 tetratricopeptide repeat protein [Oceanicoccus sp.]